MKDSKKPPKWMLEGIRSNGKAIKVSSIEEALTILESYVLTTAKYDFTVYEKRILYYCVKYAQQYLKGHKLDRNFSIASLAVAPATEISMPVADILLGEDDKNHFQVKKAAFSLLNKKIVYNDHKIWTAFTMIQSPAVNTETCTITFTVNPILWRCILDFSQGFHPFELQAAMQFTSVYSMRFYEYVSQPRDGFHPKVSINTIRGWFGLEDKYADTNDFIKRVVKAAQKDLDKSAPWSFDFEPVKEGRKITAIEIFPRQCPANGSQTLQDEVAKRRDEVAKQKAIKSRKKDKPWDWCSDGNVAWFMQNTLHFTDKEVESGIEDWSKAMTFIPDLYSFLNKAYNTALEKEADGSLNSTIKAYIIGCIRKGWKQARNKSSEDKFNNISDDIANRFNFK